MYISKLNTYNKPCQCRNTIPHTLLKLRIKELIQRCCSKKNVEQRYQYIVIGRDFVVDGYFNKGLVVQ